MEKIKSRQYNLEAKFSEAIALTLKTRFDLDIKDSKKIAASIQKMSDFYIQNPSAQTPWKESWCQIAQIAYFLPLNFIRAQAVMDEAKKVGFLEQFESFTDFGSGLGALTFHLMDFYKNGSAIEISHEAADIYRDLSRAMKKHSVSVEKFYGRETNNPKVLHSYSYSLTEDMKSGDELKGITGFFIIEPSTQQDGRRLQEYRQRLITQGFYMWAPCTHQESCPLLTHSKKDWCHDRIHLDMPQWFLDIENHLPFKNRTITFSYLLASRNNPKTIQHTAVSLVPSAHLPTVPELLGVVPQAPRLTAGGGVRGGVARTVGDTQEEKGKSKIMICRGAEREFLSWLHRDYKKYEIPRGIVMDIPDVEVKANELRIKKSNS